MNRFYTSRRNFIKKSAAFAATSVVFPYISSCGNRVTEPMKRRFGNFDFDVTTLGLGGQASLQWTPADVDPVKIILKAFNLGVNYFDTSNLYGPSQTNFGKAFQELDLIPSISGYNQSLRESIWLTSKTHVRYAKGDLNKGDVNNWTNGKEGTHTVDDVKRSLSQLFGDGKGNYPKGAYLDLVLLHDMSTINDVEAVFLGYHNPDPKAEEIGALAALRDLRDGTNLTGLNPGEEKLIRHIGFSGHHSAPVMMELIRRDTENLLEGMLVSINSNDKLNLNMQHNVIPVAQAKNMGIIAMKVFADGAMYTKKAEWSNVPDHVIRTVGSEKLPCRPLIEYSLTTPGVHTAIIGIGQINDNDPFQCQLEQNLSSAQVKPDALSQSDREAIEQLTKNVKGGKTNYFQVAEGGLTAPQSVNIAQAINQGNREIRITWNTAYAGPQPIEKYLVKRDGTTIADIQHLPQTTMEPFELSDNPGDKTAHQYIVETVDSSGQRVASDPLHLQAL